MTKLRLSWPLLTTVATALVTIVLLAACQNEGSHASPSPAALKVAVLSPTASPGSRTVPPASPAMLPTMPAVLPASPTVLPLTPTPAEAARLLESSFFPIADASEELETSHLHRRNGDYSRAISGYKAVLFTWPSSPEAKEALYWLGRTYLLDEQYDMAVQAFQDFLQSYPQDQRRDQVVFLLAASEKGLGHWGKAIEYYQAYASKGTVIDSYANLEMANIYTDAQDFARAIESFQVVLSDDIPSWLELRAMEGIARSYLSLENHEISLYWYGELLSRATTKGERARILYLMGMASEKAGEMADAKGAFLEVVGSYPSAPEAYAALEALLEMDPDAVGHYQRGMVRYYSRQFEIALSSFQSYLDAYPWGADAARAHFYAGLSYWNMDDHDQALAEFGKLAEFHPQDDLADDALWHRASIFESLSRYDEAIREYRELEARYPLSKYNKDAIFREGLSYLRQGDYEGAREIWAREAEDYAWVEFDSRTLFWMGKLFLLTGEKEEAGAYFQKAQAEEPGDYYAVRASALYSGERAFSSLVAMPDQGLPNREKVEQEELERWLSEWAFREPNSGDVGELSSAIKQDLHFQSGEELLAVGLRVDATAEFRQLAWRFWSDAWNLYQLSVYYRDHGLYQLSILCADRIVALSPASIHQAPRFLQKLVYPIYFADLVEAESEKRGIDPLLLFCLIRQESMFEHYALSSAQARGLTQVIPSTGYYIAQSLGRDDFRVDDLNKPYISVEFGAWYLAAQAKYFHNDAFLALAAYNGGPGNVMRWLGDDPEYDIDLFVEDIPFLQTRTYINKIYQYYELYKAIYGAEQVSP